MNKFKKVLTLLIAIVSLAILASCNNGVEGSIKVYDSTVDISKVEKSILFTVDFEEGEIFKDGGAKAYVALYEGETYKTTKDVSFTNEDCTEGEVKFTNLTIGVEYTAKLNYTLDGTKNFVAEVKAKIEGSDTDAISITSKDDFFNMTNNLSGNYVLANDLAFTEDDKESLEKISVFTSSKVFKGTFDGQGHTIKNFGLTSNTYMGLFGYTDGATIKNLVIENVKADLSRSETYMGVVVGKAVNTTIENVTVKNVTFKFKANPSAKVSLGGFAGHLTSSTVTNCSIEGVSIDVTHARKEMVLGLFAGYSEGNTTIENCYAKGNLSACVYFYSSSDDTTIDYLYAGGFVGVSDSKNPIKACYVDAAIKITEDSSKTTDSETHRLSVGGFVGGNRLGALKVEDCLAVVDLDVTTKHSNKAYVGGLVGRVIHSSSTLKNTSYVAKEQGIKLDSKLQNVSVSLLISYSETEKVEAVFAYTDKIIVPEGITPVAVTPVLPDANLTNLKTTVNYK